MSDPDELARLRAENNGLREQARYMESLRDLARLGCYLIDHWSEGGGADIEGSTIIEWLDDAGVIALVPGGFNSEEHEAGNYDVVDGDDWYMLTKTANAAKQWAERMDANERRALAEQSMLSPQANQSSTGNMRQQEVGAETPAERAPEAGEGPAQNERDQ